MKKLRLIFVGIILTIAFTVFTSCTYNSEDFDPVLTEQVDNTEIENSKSDPNGGEEEEEEGAGSTGGPG